MNNQETLVSAIVTTHKRTPEMVIKAIKSIERQTYSNIEIIVVDDSPVDYELRDDVKKAITSHNSQIKYIAHEKNMGACAARNTGLSVANGEYVAFLDDDDEWIETKTEKQLSLFNENIVLVFCGSIVVTPKNPKGVVVSKKIYTGNVYEKLMIKNYIGSTSIPLIKKSALVEIGGFDINLQSAQDYDVWLRLSKIGEVAYFDEPLIKYYYSDIEKIGSDPKKKIQGLERIISKNMDYLSEHKRVFAIRKKMILIFYTMEYGKYFALKKWTDAVITYPFSIKDNIRRLFRILKYKKK